MNLILQESGSARIGFLDPAALAASTSHEPGSMNLAIRDEIREWAILVREDRAEDGSWRPTVACLVGQGEGPYLWGLRSSAIEGIRRSGDHLIVTTRNSLYRTHGPCNLQAAAQWLAYVTATGASLGLPRQR